MNVLLTGATGVVGRALLPKLAGHDVTCLIHSDPMSGHKTLRGDVRLPRLGLSRGDLKELAATIDVIVHAAADTSLGTESVMAETNVTGTARIVELAREAEARLIHVSTAFSAMSTEGDAPALAYARTKAHAEEVVRASGLPAVVVRPSIIVGDSRTGRIARHQGFHKLLEAFLRGLLPIIPMDPSRLLDFVPQDVVADGIAGLLDRDADTTELWLTAGTRALPLGTTVDEVRAAAAELGRPVAPVRFADPDLYERLIVPVFLQAVPAPTRRLMSALVEQLAPYMAVREPFPSDVDELPDQALTLRATVRGWARTSGFRPHHTSGAVQ
ncbi:SDR family oxidoreductase [Streptomyces sp. NPDC021100]|uniref:SDR family oxidoreductase n=1 Tax=Streptomyces sp. NPDC021100 TaxID=3365114 RepID=UPI0037BCEBA7